MRRQEFGRRQVILEMDGAELPLGFANLGRQRAQGRGRYRSFGKGAIERRFAGDQRLARRNRFRLHGIKQPPHSLTQVGAEFELVGQLEHMHRSRISVQLGREREAHSAPRPQVRHLLVAQRLDRSLMQACVRRAAVLMLRGGQAAEGDDRYCCKG
jgi:hypothetical protein